MSFWQENYAFIKDVYDSRAAKMTEIMDNTEKAIGDVVADKIYTSAEFKKVKEVFTGLARNLEQPEIKDWLTTTKDTLMSEKSGKDQDKESKKLKEFLLRFDEMMLRVNDTKNVVDCLWKSYQYTDELTPLMEWLEESVSKSTREINSSSAGETEEHQERQEKILDQLDKKRKAVMDQKTKGEKILTDPKAPKFLYSHLDKLNALWTEANKAAEDRLKALKDNLVAWERYERERDALADKLNSADTELSNTIRVYNLEGGPADLAERRKTAAAMRKDITGSFTFMSEAHKTLCQLLDEVKKAELDEEVDSLKVRLVTLDNMDEKITKLDEFNGQLKEFDGKIKEIEDWLLVGRKRMDDLVNPPAPIEAQERVMQTMELQTDVQLQCEEFQLKKEYWDQTLAPQEAAENTDDTQIFIGRMNTVSQTQGKLFDEVKVECSKYGDDVKYLADFTAGVKKFDPWIQKSEAKKSVGMIKPTDLQEATDQLNSSKVWQEEAKKMKAVLDEANAAAQKMTLHDDADAKYAAFSKRWAVIDATAKDWIDKYEKMVAVWQKQADTAAKVTAAIAAKPGAPGQEGQPEMKLEDLEKHLDALKAMFIEKQKMMEQLEKTAGDGAAAAAAAPEAAPAAPAAAAAPIAT